MIPHSDRKKQKTIIMRGMVVSQSCAIITGISPIKQGTHMRFLHKFLLQKYGDDSQ
jgi:hypothetical protein